MNIKLTNYPYQDHKVGEVCDFGEAKNKSLVAMRRAVWYKEPHFTLIKSPLIKPNDTEPTEKQDIQTPKKTGSKKLIKNEIKEQIQQQKSQTDQAGKAKTNFWDRLK